MLKIIDLRKYAMFTAPKLETGSVYNTLEDYKVIEHFNRSMAEVHRDYSAKEKLSCVSAKKLVLTD